MSPYDILGVATNATADEIKAAYRQKSRDHHPDRGGSVEDMQAVNRANDVLSDPEKRRRFDETGEGDGFEASPLEAILMQRISRMIETAQPGQDVVKAVRYQVHQEVNAFEVNLAVARKELPTWEKRVTEFTSTGPRNLFAMAINRRVKAIKDGIQQFEQAIVQGQAMLALLDQHEHRPAAQKKSRSQSLFYEIS